MNISHIVMTVLLGVTAAYAQEGKSYEKKEVTETAKVAPSLAMALKEAKISLGQGLLASEKAGKPISGKFEMEDGKLQLSIYTMKGDQFFEVVVDHKNGRVLKTEPITGGDDLKAAKSQAGAMAKAKTPLHQLVGKVEKMNPGFKAISVTPEFERGETHADLLLLKGEESKRVDEKF